MTVLNVTWMFPRSLRPTEVFLLLHILHGLGSMSLWSPKSDTRELYEWKTRCERCRSMETEQRIERSVITLSKTFASSSPVPLTTVHPTVIEEALLDPFMIEKNICEETVPFP